MKLGTKLYPSFPQLRHCLIVLMLHHSPQSHWDMIKSGPEFFTRRNTTIYFLFTLWNNCSARHNRRAPTALEWNWFSWLGIAPSLFDSRPHIPRVSLTWVDPVNDFFSSLLIYKGAICSRDGLQYFTSGGAAWPSWTARPGASSTSSLNCYWCPLSKRSPSFWCVSHNHDWQNPSYYAYADLSST